MNDNRDQLTVGIIGGGRLPELWGMPYERISVTTPFGSPSDAVARTELGNGTVVCSLLRHGQRHAAGADVNDRANVAALHQLGCDLVVSLCLAGSLSPRLDVGATVIYDDVIDFRRSAVSYFAKSSGRHVAMAPLVEPGLAEQLASVGTRLDLAFGASMVVIEGPRYSTLAESRMFRMLGGDLISQSVAPECFLVREQDMAWCGACLVTDRDVRDPDQLVSTRLIFENMKRYEARFSQDVLQIVESLRRWSRVRAGDEADVPRAELAAYRQDEAPR